LTENLLLEMLRVLIPSAIVPVECNYLLNPEHPDLKIVTKEPAEFKFDRRMWKK